MHIQIYTHPADSALLTLGLRSLSRKEDHRGSSFIIRSAPGERGVRERAGCVIHLVPAAGGASLGRPSPQWGHLGTSEMRRPPMVNGPR